MFRISKIIKKYQEDKDKQPKQSTPGASSGGPGGSDEAVPPTAGEGKAPQSGRMSMAGALSKRPGERASESQLHKLYLEGLEMARYIYTADLTHEPNFMNDVNTFVLKVINLLQSGDRELPLDCLTDYPTMEEHLYYHTVNVCIISLEIGAGLAYERSKLMELGASAFVHDIGLKSLHVIEDTATVLDKEDYEMIRRHPEEGVKLLSSVVKDINPRIAEVVMQEHERRDGSGYPRGLKDDAITEYAQIVGLADVYEAMMHQRPYRRKYTSLEAVSTIVKNKKIFGPKIVKALIEQFGVFPVGIPVQLNTKEIGIVVEKNPEQPLRPVVSIVIDSTGHELKEPKLIDLADNPVIYVEDCVKEELKV
ncbi:MAG: HD domain-containing protein [Candidatus Omnitrophica bacterium]|nr:HD domain-containing protein [Candidatus Omnitrophota bacterium]